MTWTVLTVITESHTPPRPGEDVAVGVREKGCSACVIRNEKLKLCIKHHRERVWNARTVEIRDEPNDVQTTASEGLSEVGSSTRNEEPVEVSEGSVELSPV